MVPLNVEESGPHAAPVLLMLHGLANSRRTFGFAADALGSRARVLRADLRGHGASPHCPGAYRLADFVDDVEAVLDRVGPAFVVGNSLGGAITWTLAQRRPDLVRAALPEDPPMRRTDVAAAGPVFTALRDQAVRWRTEGIAPGAVAAALAAAPGPDGRYVADVQAPGAIEARARALLEMDPSVVDAVVDGTTLSDLDVEAPVTVPVRILAADAALGSALPPTTADELLAVQPRVSVRRLAGAGHVIHDEVTHRPTWLAEVGTLLDQLG